MFDFLFNPQGRISRKGFWAFALAYIAISIVTAILAGVHPLLGLVNFLIGLFFLWPSVVAVPVKRFHDLGMTGFWQLGYILAEIVLLIAFFAGIGFAAASTGRADEFGAINSLPEDEQAALMMEVVLPALTSPVCLVSGLLLLAVNLVWLFFQGVKRGKPGPNEHGEDPLASGRGFAD